MRRGNSILAWKIVFTSSAQKDSIKIQNSGLHKKVAVLLDIISENPYTTPPSYEKLKGALEGYYSRRINIQHRLVYKIYEKEQTLQIIRMWTHYE